MTLGTQALARRGQLASATLPAAGWLTLGGQTQGGSGWGSAFEIRPSTASRASMQPRETVTVVRMVIPQAKERDTRYRQNEG